MRFLTRKSKRLSRKQTHALLATFTVLLESGFSLQESLLVLLRSGQFDPNTVKDIDQRLKQGQRLRQAFSLLHLSEAEQNQLDLAETHGNLVDTLQRMVAYQILLEKQNQTLQKVLAYPLLLLVFVFTALFAMRRFLLPQLLASGMIDANHWGILFITAAPWIGAVIVGGLGGFVLVVRGIFAKQTALKRAAFLSRLPFLGDLYRCYQTSYFALEWGKLFQQGLGNSSDHYVHATNKYSNISTRTSCSIRAVLGKWRIVAGQIKGLCIFDARVFIDCVPGRNAWEIRRRIVCL